MEIVELDADMESGIMDETGLTDEQKHRNYKEIVETLDYIEAGGRITEDFLCECKWMIIKWRDWIPNFRVINEDNETTVFRQMCANLEDLMTELYRATMMKNDLDLKLFTIFLRNMKRMCDTTFEDDDLTDMLNSMNF